MIRRNLKDIEMLEEEWCDVAVRLRARWRTLYCDGLESYRESQVVCASVAARVVHGV